MKILYLKGYKWLLSFFVIDGTRYWLSISNLFIKSIKVKARQSQDCNVLIIFI